MYVKIWYTAILLMGVKGGVPPGIWPAPPPDVCPYSLCAMINAKHTGSANFRSVIDPAWMTFLFNSRLYGRCRSWYCSSVQDPVKYLRVHPLTLCLPLKLWDLDLWIRGFFGTFRKQDLDIRLWRVCRVPWLLQGHAHKDPSEHFGCSAAHGCERETDTGCSALAQP